MSRRQVVGQAFQPDADRTGSDGVGLESPTYLSGWIVETLGRVLL